jgi:hypothetical protein
MREDYKEKKGRATLRTAVRRGEKLLDLGFFGGLDLEVGVAKMKG